MMNVRFYEMGVRQVASGLVSLSSPTPESTAQMANQLETMAAVAADAGRGAIATLAQTACEATQALGGAEAGARATCIDVLEQLGQQLLAGLCGQVRRSDDDQPVTDTRHRVLVVDDSRVAGAALLNAFRARGYAVRTAATLDEAFAELVLFAPSVLVSDVFMPGVDLELLARVFRSLSHGRLNLLVLVSGSTGPELATRVKEVQPDIFVSKTSGAASVVDKVMAMHAPTSPSPGD